MGALGLLQTNWTGFESSEDNLKSRFNHFSAIILAAEYAWNSGKIDLEHLPYNADEEFRRQWDAKPVDRTPRKGFTLDLSSACNVGLADNERKTGWLGLGAEHDLSSVPTGESQLKGDLFKIGPSAIRLASALDSDRAYPERVELAVGLKARSLIFLQTCAWTDRARRKIGAYKINYADGSSETVDLAYGFNVVAWNDPRSLGGADKVWQGRTKDGEKASLVRFAWDNPHPDKEIVSIEFSSTRTEAGPVLAAVSAME